MVATIGARVAIFTGEFGRYLRATDVTARTHFKKFRHAPL